MIVSIIYLHDRKGGMLFDTHCIMRCQNFLSIHPELIGFARNRLYIGLLLYFLFGRLNITDAKNDAIKY